MNRPRCPSALTRPPLGFLLSTTFRQVRQLLSRHLEPHRITPPQYGVLMMMLHGPHLSLSELARQAMGDSPTVCRIVDRLERRGFVRRDKDEADRRCLLMQLTDRGRKLGLACQSIADEMEAALLAGLSGQEVQTLHALLGRVLDNARTLNSQTEDAP
jgi:DNA-binding MarR family transcriptional regulator